MNYAIPFHKNWGHRCGQAVMKMAIGSLYPDRQISYRELDELTLRERGKGWTSLTQIAKGFLDLGIDFKYLVKDGTLKIFADKNIESYLRDFYASDADKLLSVINQDALSESVRAIEKSGKAIVEKPSMEYLRECCKRGDLNICTIDNSVADGRARNNEGHIILMTWIGDRNVYYHDCGPVGAMPNRKIAKERFKDAWESTYWADYGTITLPRSQAPCK